MKNLALKTKSYIASASEVLNVEIQGLSDLAASLDSNFDRAIDLILNTKGRVIISGIGKVGILLERLLLHFLLQALQRYSFMLQKQAMVTLE